MLNALSKKLYIFLWFFLLFGLFLSHNLWGPRTGFNKEYYFMWNSFTPYTDTCLTTLQVHLTNTLNFHFTPKHASLVIKYMFDVLVVPGQTWFFGIAVGESKSLFFRNQK